MSGEEEDDLEIVHLRRNRSRSGSGKHKANDAALRSESPLKRLCNRSERADSSSSSSFDLPQMFGGGHIEDGDVDRPFPSLRVDSSLSVECRRDTIEGKVYSNSCALFFDFDCTLSANHLYGTVRRWRMWMPRFDKAFPTGLEVFSKCGDPSDSRWIEELLSNQEFVRYIFGGIERIQMIKCALRKCQSAGAEIFISTFGTCLEVILALRSVGLLKFFSRIQAANGLWEAGGKIQTYREMNVRRTSKLDWIEKVITERNIAASATWFVDDSKSNYDDGYGCGVLSNGRKINVLMHEDFKQNGNGFSNSLFEGLVRTVTSHSRESAGASKDADGEEGGLSTRA